VNQETDVKTVQGLLRHSNWSYGRIWVYICLKPKMLDSAKIQISPEILSLIAEIDEFKGAWRALGTLAP